MITNQEKIYEFYIKVLKELQMEDEVQMSGDQENYFAYAFKRTFGYFPENF